MPVENVDLFVNQEPQLNSPAEGAFAVTPSNDDDLAISTRYLYVGGAGSGALKVTMVNGVVMTFAGLLAGTLLPIRVKKVFATGTNVTNIVGLY